MEYRRRTVSNVFDNEIDIEKQIPKRHSRSASIDEQLDQYSEYVYNGTFSFSRMFCCGIIKLICPCWIRQSEPITVIQDDTV